MSTNGEHNWLSCPRVRVIPEPGMNSFGVRNFGAGITFSSGDYQVTRWFPEKYDNSTEAFEVAREMDSQVSAYILDDFQGSPEADLVAKIPDIHGLILASIPFILGKERGAVRDILSALSDQVVRGVVSLRDARRLVYAISQTSQNEESAISELYEPSAVPPWDNMKSALPVIAAGSVSKPRHSKGNVAVREEEVCQALI